MKKFLLLVKKELQELMTPQLILPFVLVMVVFMVIGKTAGKQIENQAKVKEPVLIINHDSGELSTIALQAAGSIADIKTAKTTEDDKIVDEMNQKKIDIGLIIPANFTADSLQSTKTKIKTYSLLRDFSVAGSKKASTLNSITAIINETVSNSLIQLNLPNVSPLDLKSPISTISYVSANGKTVPGSAIEVLSYVSQQTNYLPIILFIVIVFAAQMIAVAVATEKENKTLETLLSLPVSRKAIVTAKMIAAGLISLLMAGIYMYGLKEFIGGLGATAAGGLGTGENTAAAVSALGLKFTTTGYVELGVILFLGILFALAVAMILGAFSEDAKSAQSVIAPLMVLVMIPYFAVLLLDINQLSPLLRGIIYAIPFSHIFLAGPNILLGNNTFVLWGILYLLVLFIIFVYIAAKIFSSDLILTMKLNFSKKK